MNYADSDLRNDDNQETPRKSVAEEYQQTKKKAARDRNRKLRDRKDKDLHIGPKIPIRILAADEMTDLDLTRVKSLKDLSDYI